MRTAQVLDAYRAAVYPVVATLGGRPAPEVLPDWQPRDWEEWWEMLKTGTSSFFDWQAVREACGLGVPLQSAPAPNPHPRCVLPVFLTEARRAPDFWSLSFLSARSSAWVRLRRPRSSPARRIHPPLLVPIHPSWGSPTAGRPVRHLCIHLPTGGHPTPLSVTRRARGRPFPLAIRVRPTTTRPLLRLELPPPVTPQCRRLPPNRSRFVLSRIRRLGRWRTSIQPARRRRQVHALRRPPSPSLGRAGRPSSRQSRRRLLKRPSGHAPSAEDSLTGKARGTRQCRTRRHLPCGLERSPAWLEFRSTCLRSQYRRGPESSTRRLLRSSLRRARSWSSRRRRSSGRLRPGQRSVRARRPQPSSRGRRLWHRLCSANADESTPMPSSSRGSDKRRQRPRLRPLDLFRLPLLRPSRLLRGRARLKRRPWFPRRTQSALRPSRRPPQPTPVFRYKAPSSSRSRGGSQGPLRRPRIRRLSQPELRLRPPSRRPNRRTRISNASSPTGTTPCARSSSHGEYSLRSGTSTHRSASSLCRR